MRNRKSVFDRPELVLGAFILVSVLVWTLQCSIFQRVLGIDIYETIVWGEEMQWGYSKHPPLSGWLGYFFSWVTGHRDWGLYLAAQLSIGLGVFFTFLTARQFFERYRAAAAALLLYFLLYYTPSEMKFCTYLVEIALAPIAAYLLIRSLRENKVWQWSLLGAVCGLGILNKYSFGLILVGFAIVVMTRREYRRRLASWKPYLAALIFLAVLAPHLNWLVEHHFVCFGHVGSRLEQKHNILMPLFVLGAALYPLAMEAVAVALALLPGAPRAEGGKWFSLAGWKAAAKNREALHFAGVVSLLPGAVYLVLALTGTDIILMWLCSVASLSGIAVMSLCPVEVDKRLFRRLSILLAAFIAAVLIGMVIDVLCRTSDGVHMEPAPVVEAAETFWKEHSDKPIPVAVGGLRFAALLDHYSRQHPPVCEPDDDVMIDLYRERIRKHGALLIDAREKDFDEFLKRAGTKVVFRRCMIKFGSRFGKKKTRYFVLGYLPPGTEIK
ncbi:MAG: glycosyltransferase family 39 protein [Lentisphaeria bacterium]|nr:glycosyltransferase family 39 protein [Lentisphaeria bacterium]